LPDLLELAVEIMVPGHEALPELMLPPARHQADAPADDEQTARNNGNE
jgi:hypothetical protein